MPASHCLSSVWPLNRLLQDTDSYAMQPQGLGIQFRVKVHAWVLGSTPSPIPLPFPSSFLPSSQFNWGHCHFTVPPQSMGNWDCLMPRKRFLEPTQDLPLIKTPSLPSLRAERHRVLSPVLKPQGHLSRNPSLSSHPALGHRPSPHC